MFADAGQRIEYTVGTMIELPRAAIVADKIAEIADFFSFGTNDLTQTVFGLSRDDAGKFLPDYVEQGILPKDPFVSIDVEGVGAMIRMAGERGRKTKPKLKLGICGEHGGDPASIAFCETARAGLRVLQPVPRAGGAAGRGAGGAGRGERPHGVTLAWGQPDRVVLNMCHERRSSRTHHVGEVPRVGGMPAGAL